MASRCLPTYLPTYLTRLLLLLPTAAAAAAIIISLPSHCLEHSFCWEILRCVLLPTYGY
ncbi:hypothetical protein LZ31DRAFT_555661 [Colletotrichum somersetense]|nr:hypothetical protein LZ31DRAFT_555661 [Colletotrichum somersetense]